jgi:hypothetical protein
MTWDPLFQLILWRVRVSREKKRLILFRKAELELEEHARTEIIDNITVSALHNKINQKEGEKRESKIDSKHESLKSQNKGANGETKIKNNDKKNSQEVKTKIDFSLLKVNEDRLRVKRILS